MNSKKKRQRNHGMADADRDSSATRQAKSGEETTLNQSEVQEGPKGGNPREERAEGK